MKTEEQIREQYRLIRGSLDERGRREWAASEAMALGHGGIALVHRASGIVPSTIGKGIKELRQRQQGDARAEETRRVRRPGGGRPSKTSEDPKLLGSLESLMEPCTRGDPESALTAYASALEADSRFWQAEFNRALLLCVRGRYEEAEAGYRSVLESVPQHAKSHFELGLLYLGPLADRTAAERHLSAAIEAEPDHPRVAEAKRLLSG